MPRKLDYYLYTECGHKLSVCENWKDEDQIEEIPGCCYPCRLQRIGSEIEFVRYGNFPAGSSVNHITKEAEGGVSVYEIKDGRLQLVGFHFGITERRTAFRGTGRIVGWGSDGEPLVEVLTSKKLSKAQLEKLESAPRGQR